MAGDSTTAGGKAAANATAPPPLPVAVEEALAQAAARFGTPCYVYFLDGICERIDAVSAAFDGRFVLSYAVKANPNPTLLERLNERVGAFDVSSIGEVEAVLRAGAGPQRLSFSGPAKREDEIRRAVALGVGEMVCESRWEIELLDSCAADAGRRVPFLVRINPAKAPRHFQVSMAGRATQFGVDEENMDELLSQLDSWKNLDLQGFHIYSGTNCLDVDALVENFTIFAGLFTRFSEKFEIYPRKLIFGSGFGVPYTAKEQELDFAALAPRINRVVDEMRRSPNLSEAVCALELGRYLVGPPGYFLTSVVNEKHSRGTDIRMCDGGFNAHLAACGMLGSVIRRNWRMWKLGGGGERAGYMLTGPLCTTVDALALKIELPRLSRGDVVAIGCSGAYGLSSSPLRFISHPEPLEIMVEGSGPDAKMADISDHSRQGTQR